MNYKFSSITPCIRENSFQHNLISSLILVKFWENYVQTNIWMTSNYMCSPNTINDVDEYIHHLYCKLAMVEPISKRKEETKIAITKMSLCRCISIETCICVYIYGLQIFYEDMNILKIWISKLFVAAVGRSWSEPLFVKNQDWNALFYTDN